MKTNLARLRGWHGRGRRLVECAPYGRCPKMTFGTEALGYIAGGLPLPPLALAHVDCVTRVKRRVSRRLAS